MRQRVLSQLLAELEGLQPRQQVLVVAATNRPDLLDAALLRPGRFDRLVYVPVPDTAARASILQVQLRQMRVAVAVNVRRLAERTEGFTGADLSALCNAAAMHALDESIDAPEIAARHFKSALETTQPSPPPEPALLEVYRRMQRGGSFART